MDGGEGRHLLPPNYYGCTYMWLFSFFSFLVFGFFFFCIMDSSELELDLDGHDKYM